MDYQRQAKDAFARVKGLEYMLKKIGTPGRPYAGMDRQTLQNDLEIAQEDLRRIESQVKSAGAHENE